MNKYLRKTKIVCTIGPASEDKLVDLMNAGMDVVRINFSHGSYPEQKEKIEKFFEARKKVNKPVALLLDTQGPEVRIGMFKEAPITLKKGDTFTLVNDDITGDETKVSISYKELYKDVKVGTIILVDDGLIELKVKEIKGKDVICEVDNGGKLGNRKSVNIPGVHLSLPALKEKDIQDLKDGARVGFDYIAASFIRNKEDVLAIRKVLDENGGKDIKIICKIENQEGLDNLEEIVDNCSGIMVARGDMGVEIPYQNVPVAQKEIIKLCNRKGKAVITATQMLESMQENPRPTRAEVSDVANAIYDGTDAIMLSGESAQGKYPEEAVMVMNKIAIKTESTLDYASLHRKAVRTASDDPSEAICMSVAEIATKFNVAAIVAFTESGFTAKKMSRYRPECPIIAATPYEKTTKKLAINWGVKSVICKHMDTTEGLLNLAEVIAKENGVNAGETILVTGGTPGVRGTTSYLQLITVK